MATVEQVRSLREQIITRIRSLREFGGPIKEPLDETEQAFQVVRHKLSKDLSGEGKEKWEDISAEN